MLAYVVAFGLLLHLGFWGAGLAILAMPRPWARFWPVLALAAGAALQSLVVWAGAYADLKGTNAYAWPSEGVPLALLGFGLWRRRAGFFDEIGRLGAVWALVGVCLGALVRPLVRAASGLTTVSLGSCDAADYAAGARVLMEFAHSDRSGFLGLTDVVRVMSVDNFFDYWLRLNHFTPSALIALNGAVFDCAPYELTGLMTAVVMVAALPVVFWMARAVFGYRLPASIGVTAIFGFSPIMAYAVYESAIGQLLAAPAIAIVTWAGVALWRGSLGSRQRWRFFGVLAIAYALLLGSYNFFIVVALAPAAAYAVGLAAWTGAWKRLVCWAAVILAPLAPAGAVFWARVAGLAERFELLGKYSEGWPVPRFSPEGWLGFVQGPGLDPLPGPARPVLAACVVAALVWALGGAALRRKRRAYLVVALAAPVFAGYLFALRTGGFGTKSSYNAYKVFAVFYPILLPALCVWLAPWLRGARWAGWAAAGFGGLVVVGNLHASKGFWQAMETPPLVVDRDLIRVQTIETNPEVHSINMRMGTQSDLWPRLWANAFLLKKPQYFPWHTYEGRLDTPLRGEWDLSGGLVSVSLPDHGSIQVDPRFTLVRVASPYYLRADVGAGWYDEERLPRSSTRWRWTSAVATVDIYNPEAQPLKVELECDGESLTPRAFQAWMGGTKVAAAAIGAVRNRIRTGEFKIPPGTTRLELRSDLPPSRPDAADRRLLGFKVYGLAINVIPGSDGGHR